MEAHGQEVVPVGEEECLLGDAQQTCHQGEQGQPVLGLDTVVHRLAVQHLHKVLQTRDVHFILHGLENEYNIK